MEPQLKIIQQSNPTDDHDFPFHPDVRSIAKHTTNTLLASIEPPFKTFYDYFYPDTRFSHPLATGSIDDRSTNYVATTAPRYLTGNEELWSLFTKNDAKFVTEMLELQFVGFNKDNTPTNDYEHGVGKSTLERSEFRTEQRSSRNLDVNMGENELAAKKHINSFTTEITKMGGCPQGPAHDECDEKDTNENTYTDEQLRWNQFHARAHCTLDKGRIATLVSSLDMLKGGPRIFAHTFGPCNGLTNRQQKRYIYQEEFGYDRDALDALEHTPASRVMFGVLESDSSLQLAMRERQIQTAEKKSHPFLEYSRLFTECSQPLGPPLPNESQLYLMAVWFRRCITLGVWPHIVGHQLPFWDPSK